MAKLTKFWQSIAADRTDTGKNSLLAIKHVFKTRNGLLFIAIFALVGTSLLVMSRAATSPVAFEAESGVLTGGATSVANANASGGRVLAFSGGATPTPAPTPTRTPTPAPTPTPSPIGNPAWRGDYQTSLLSGWVSEQQMVRAAQQARVTAASVGIPTRAGFPYVGRFIVAPGDYTNGGNQQERSEVYASIANTGNPTQGQTMWFAWSAYFPAGFHVDSDAQSPVGNGWIVTTQWHGSGPSGNPVINFAMTKGTSTPHLTIDTQGGAGRSTAQQWIMPTALPLGRWNDFRIGIAWGTSPSVGRITVRMNGTTLLNNWPCANLFNGESAYFKQGLYRASSNQTQTVYYTGTRRGPTEASVSY